VWVVCNVLNEFLELAQPVFIITAFRCVFSQSIILYFSLAIPFAAVKFTQLLSDMFGPCGHRQSDTAAMGSSSSCNESRVQSTNTRTIYIKWIMTMLLKRITKITKFNDNKR